jgi:thiamine transporter ThiT
LVRELAYLPYFLLFFVKVLAGIDFFAKFANPKWGVQLREVLLNHE